MLASEYIAKLQALVAEHGDLEVWEDMPYRAINAARPAYPPKLAYKKVPKKAERTDKFFSEYLDYEYAKGAAVIKVG